MVTMTDSTTPAPQFVAYYRVSTEKQGKARSFDTEETDSKPRGSGLGMEAQIAAVQQHVKRSGGAIMAEFQEVETGKRDDRPQLQKALTLCRQKKAVLIIAKLDRLSRNVAFIANLMESQVKFIACDMPEANELTLHIMAAMAQHERKATSQRTKEALQAAKARGQQLGNPNADLPHARAMRSEQTGDFREGVAPLARQLRGRGLTLRQIAQELNERHIKTCNNRLWHGETVRRLLTTTAKDAA